MPSVKIEKMGGNVVYQNNADEEIQAAIEVYWRKRKFVEDFGWQVQDTELSASEKQNLTEKLATAEKVIAEVEDLARQGGWYSLLKNSRPLQKVAEPSSIEAKETRVNDVKRFKPTGSGWTEDVYSRQPRYSTYRNPAPPIDPRYRTGDDGHQHDNDVPHHMGTGRSATEFVNMKLKKPDWKEGDWIDIIVDSVNFGFGKGVSSFGLVLDREIQAGRLFFTRPERILGAAGRLLKGVLALESDEMPTIVELLGPDDQEG